MLVTVCLLLLLLLFAFINIGSFMTEALEEMELFVLKFSTEKEVFMTSQSSYSTHCLCHGWRT